MAQGTFFVILEVHVYCIPLCGYSNCILQEASYIRFEIGSNAACTYNDITDFSESISLTYELNYEWGSVTDVEKRLLVFSSFFNVVFLLSVFTFNMKQAQFKFQKQWSFISFWLIKDWIKLKQQLYEPCDMVKFDFRGW